MNIVRIGCAVVLALGICAPASAASVFINEIHYDNSGADVGEFVEIAGPAGTDLTGWSIALYNGSSSQLNVYDTIALSGTLTNSANGFGFAAFLRSGIQNGAPDGLALIDASSNVVQFLSYEGVFTAGSGPATGLTSTDIGVEEPGAAGESLQLTGTGNEYEDFTWSGPVAETPDAVNNGQSFGGTPPPTPSDVLINEFLVKPASNSAGDANGDGTADHFEDEFVEIVNNSGAPLNISGWTLSDVDGASAQFGGPAGVRHTFPADTIIPTGCAMVVFGGGTPTGDFGGALVQTADTGLIQLNNGGDTLVLADADGGMQASADYGSGADDGDARTRDPDISGTSFDPHSGATGSNGTLFSPGTRIDGSRFAGCPIDLSIHDVQGSGDATPYNGQVVRVAGIVTGDFQDGNSGGDDGDLRGFYIQEESPDADTLTSEGIFVFDGTSPLVDVAVGDRVIVTGEATEFFGLTEISATAGIVHNTGTQGTISPTPVSLPAAASVANADGELIADLEQYEGMLVQFTDVLSVTEYFNLDRFGEILLSQGGRLFQFTNANAPDATGFATHLDDKARRTVMLDDGSSMQNSDPIRYPAPGLDAANTVRGGDTVSNLTGVLHYSRGSGGSGDEHYRLMPTVEPGFVAANQRPAIPLVPGNLKVASFNVLNFFNTLDTGNSSQCFLGGSQVADACRGANSQDEYDRQLQKLVTTLQAIDADIYGLVELENDIVEGENSSIDDLVEALNAAGGTPSCGANLDWVDTVDRAGSDAIATGFIYCTQTARLADGTTVESLDDSDPVVSDLFGSTPVFDGAGTNRSPVAATFEETASAGRFTVVVTHMKSKGSAGPGPDDEDANDGAGFSNGTRLRGVQALDAWLQTDPTGSGDADFLIVGDLNAYLMEDPVRFLEDAGYSNLLTAFATPPLYSFVFDGQAGALDHAFATSSLVAQIDGAAEWHNNADEPDGLDYNLDFGRPADIFDGSDPYRASDHDPVIVGLSLTMPSLEGDIDGDGDIDGHDHRLLLRSLFSYQGQRRYNPDADLDHNGIVDTRDLFRFYLIWRAASRSG